MSSAIPAPKRVFRGRLARTLLLILLVLFLLPALAMGSMAYLRARSLLREQIFHLLSAATDSQSQQISQRVNTGYMLLSRDAANPHLIEAMEAGLKQENQNDPAFNASRKAIFDNLHPHGIETGVGRENAFRKPVSGKIARATEFTCRLFPHTFIYRFFCNLNSRAIYG